MYTRSCREAKKLIPVQDSFGQFGGHIGSVEVQTKQIRGESAGAVAVLVTTWGSRVFGALELIREEGRTWKINNWGEFKALGSEHLSKGASLCDSHNLSSALPEYQAALAENPQDSTIYTEMGRCYLKMGNLSGAEEQFNIAIKMHPDVVWDPYIGLADLYQKRRDFPGAEEAFKKAIKNRPDYWVPYNNLAYMYAESGTKLDEAIELANKALSLLPDEAASLDTLGWAYYRKGNRARALQYLARALAKAPENKEVRAHYGEVSKP